MACPAYWFAGDIHCGLAAGHEQMGCQHHVGTPDGPNPRRLIFRWRGHHPRTHDFAGLPQSHNEPRP
jgi:hypothetical protein